METAKSTKDFLKSKSKIIFILLGVLVLITVLLFIKGKNNNDNVIVARAGDFKNQVSISGKVISATSVEMGFKNGGRVEKVYYSTDSQDKLFVKSGTLIAQVETKEALKDLHDAEIALESARLSLSKLQVEMSKENMENDLNKSYDSAFVVISDAFLDTLPIVESINDILSGDVISHNMVNISGGDTALYYRNQSEDLYYKTKKTFDTYQKDFRQLTRTSSGSEIEKNLNEVYDLVKITLDTLKSTKNLVDYLSDKQEDSITYLNLKNTLGQYISTINSHLSSIPRARTEINNSKDAFLNTDLEIKSLSLDIKQKQNSLQEAKNNLDDYYIRAPFDGVITKIHAKVGETVSPEAVMVEMMNDGTFQIESYIPEISIASVKVGSSADVTLDAYGDSVLFQAKVVSIDTAETIRDGVSTYKVKLIFDNKDPRILSGMTANVLITVFSKPNVITIPKGVIYQKDGKSFIQIIKDKKIEEREIVTGQVSSLGQVEVISGVLEGDLIILSTSLK